MDEFRVLLDRFWIVRSRDAKLFRQVVRRLPEFQRTLREQFGWEIIRNEKLIRLVKTPAKPLACMGIQSFSSIKDYCLFCALLLVLEDKDANERFLLSELTQGISMYSKPYLPDLSWEQYHWRTSFVRVLHYAEDTDLIRACEGSSDNFLANVEQEVLYENTVFSRWYSVNFHHDISGYSDIQDFMQGAEDGPDLERGTFRTYRVYRQLALAPAVYWDEPSDPLYAYIKNQRGPIQKNLDNAIGGTLQVYKNGAFFLPEEGASMGQLFPKDQMLSDILLLVFASLRDKEALNGFVPDADDRVYVSKKIFFEELKACQEEYHTLWGKSYAGKEPQQLLDEVLNFMNTWGFAHVKPDEIVLNPAIALWNGFYTEK